MRAQLNNHKLNSLALRMEYKPVLTIGTMLTQLAPTGGGENWQAVVFRANCSDDGRSLITNPKK